MSDTPIRRSNWSTSSQGGASDDRNDDPLAELERIVGRTKPASAPPAAPAGMKPATSPAYSGSSVSTPPPAPGKPAGATRQDFLGISEDEFEAAFRSLNVQPSKPTASPTPQSSMSEPFSAPARQPFTSRLDPVFNEEPSFEADAKKYSSPSTRFEDNFAAAPVRDKSQEFETRADIFDFDTRASDDTTANQDDAEDERDYQEPAPAYYLENKQRSGLVTVIAVTGLVFVAVIGALIYSWVGSESGGEPVIIKADNSPVKTTPVAEDSQPTSSKLIYDRLGSAGEDASKEKLVSREEQPVENLNPQENPQGTANQTPGTTADPRVVLPNPTQETSGGLNAPRQVTTTTIRVRPDGTLENVPPAASTTPTPAPAAATTTTPDSTATASTVADEPTPPAPTPTDTAMAESEEPTPQPEERPAMQERNTVASEEPTPTPPPVQRTTPPPQRVASAPATQAARTTASSSASSGSGFVVQISSQKSEASARASFTAMQQRFPQVLAGQQASIKPVTLGERGTYYRVRVGPMAGRDEASALCARLKSAGGDCVVTAN